MIDKISADYYLSLTQEKPNSETVNQDEPSPKKLNFREDAISNAVLKHIFPQILPDKSDTFTNVMKWDCFLQLEKSLTRDGAKNIIVYIESNKEHSTIKGIACDREEINITYKAFKERLKKLLQFYKSS